MLVVIVPDLAAYEACRLPDDSLRGFTTQIVLDAAQRSAPLAIPRA